jgi:hypothetical protein
MAAIAEPGTAQSVWSRQSVWSQTANRLKAGIGRTRAAALGLTIIAAVLSTLATQVASLNSVAGRTLVVAAAVAVGLAPLVRSQLAPASVADWTRARSVSEGLKGELYTYLSGTGCYRADNRDRQLAIRTEQILTDAGDLLRYTTGVQPGTRELPAVQDVGSYLLARLDPQVTWYNTRAGELQKKLHRVCNAQFALSAAGVALAAVAATLAATEVVAWVAVATTVSAAVTAYAAASRYEYQLVEYLRTAAQLSRLRSGRVGGAADSAADDAFVRDCEQVISVQNEAWMAKWSSDSAAAPQL